MWLYYHNELFSFAIKKSEIHTKNFEKQMYPCNRFRYFLLYGFQYDTISHSQRKSANSENVIFINFENL